MKKSAKCKTAAAPSEQVSQPNPQKVGGNYSKSQNNSILNQGISFEKKKRYIYRNQKKSNEYIIFFFSRLNEEDSYKGNLDLDSLLKYIEGGKKEKTKDSKKAVKKAKQKQKKQKEKLKEEEAEKKRLE